MDFYKRIKQIKPVSQEGIAGAKSRWNRLAKPLYGLGQLEDMVTALSGIDKSLNIGKKCVAVMCADNGIVAEGVAQAGSDVTMIIAGMMAKGESAVCKMAQSVGADVFPVDVGMLTEAAGVPVHKTAKGTNNFAKKPAMTAEAAITAVNVGIDMVAELKAKGYNLIATGEMGIGNTTSSSAVCAVMLNKPVKAVTGRGAGLTDEGLAQKIRVIEGAIKLHKPDKNNPINVLSKVGGFDIAALCGVYLGGALYGVPIIIDGFISSVAALLAARLNPKAKGYMIASHCSKESGARHVLKALRLKAPIDANMALGEGTGAVALMPILDMAVKTYKDMPEFGEVNIESYKPLC